MRREAAGTDPYALACDVGAAITSSLGLDDVLPTVARQIAEAMGVWECDLYEYHPESGSIVGAALWARELTAADLDWVGTTSGLDERPGHQRVFLRGETAESYAGDDGLHPSDAALMARRGELATLSVPLVFEGQVIGCLTLVEKRKARRFDDDDRRLAALLASPAAVAVHNARMYRWEEQQNRHLASLLGATRALTSAGDPEEALGLVCREAALALDAGDAAIHEYDAARDTLVHRAAYPAPRDGAGGPVAYHLDEHPTDRDLLRSGRVLQAAASDEELPPDVREGMAAWAVKSRLAVPLLFNGEPLGLLVVAEKGHERRFTEDEVGLARGLGEQAAVAIRHAQLHRRQADHTRRLLALLETSRVLAASLDAGQVLTEMRVEAAGLFTVPPEAVTVFLQVEGEYLPLERALALLDGDDDPPGTAGPVPLDTLRRRVLDGRRPAQDGTAGVRRLVVPLLTGAATEGFLEIRAERGEPFSEAEVDLLEVLAGQAGAALVNTRLYRTVERQAITDALTGLYNHRYFYERLAQEVARAQRYGLPLSLLMVDIDDFKLFNDRFGHQTGDAVLAAVARVLAADLRRQVDLAARYGGEEFAVLLPNTAEEGAQAVGGRLVRQVAALDTGLAPYDARHGAPGTAQVTVSIGLASLSAAASPEQLVRNADKALYLAKRRGKDRLEVFGA